MKEKSRKPSDERRYSLMEIKKRIERPIESTNEFDSEYITYNAKTLLTE